MIEYDMVRTLVADPTLMTLLGEDGDDKKIYPGKPPNPVKLPYILYHWGTGDMTDEILDEDRIQLTVRAADKLAATNIRDRLKELLDKQDRIQDTTFTTGSTAYHIYWCKFSAGDGFWEPNRKIYNSVMFFLVKYRKKS